MKSDNNNSRSHDSVLKAVGRESGPDKEFLDRLKELSAREFEKAPAGTHQLPRHGLESPWRILMNNRIFKMTAAAALIAVAAIVGTQFVGGTNAYAQAVQQFKNARTVVYTLIRQANMGSGETIKVGVAYKEPGFMRTTTVDGYIAILDANTGKMMSIVPQGGYSIGDLQGVVQPNDPGPFANIEAMKALPAKADEALGSKEIDGTEAEGYRVTQGDLTTTVWIQTQTGDLVQVEHTYASAPGMNTIMKDIQIDVPLEDSLFSLTPPAGYKEFGAEMKSDASLQTEETFVAWLGWWANGNTDSLFPPMVAGPEIAKVCMDMAKQGKLKGDVWDKADTGQMFNALLFVATLPVESNWRYTGNGVKLNTPDTPIFWYRPAGSEIYRVVYADLTVREMAEDQLPK
jgi:outer membrane lipoprotein-sorting protein